MKEPAKGRLSIALFLLACAAAYGGIGWLIWWLTGSSLLVWGYVAAIGVTVFILIGLFCRPHGNDPPPRRHRPWQV